jgi:hypothetical protein
MPVSSIDERSDGDLLHRITDEVKTIARDELELVRAEIQKHAKDAAIDVAAIALGGIVALVGLGLLCVMFVAVLAPVIPALWLRLLIMAIVYMAAGGALAGVFARRLKRDARPDLEAAAIEAKQTVMGVKDALTH